MRIRILDAREGRLQLTTETSQDVADLAELKEHGFADGDPSDDSSIIVEIKNQKVEPKRAHGR